MSTTDTSTGTLGGAPDTFVTEILTRTTLPPSDTSNDLQSTTNITHTITTTISPTTYTEYGPASTIVTLDDNASLTTVYTFKPTSTVERNGTSTLTYTTTWDASLIGAQEAGGDGVAGQCPQLHPTNYFLLTETQISQ